MRTGPEPLERTRRRRALSARQVLAGAARLGPWLIFGPITGLMSEAALSCFRRGQRRLGMVYVALNILILLALPLTTALIAAHL